MQRLALFDLDNTLVDRSEAFRLWAVEFCADHGLPGDALAWLIASDQDGSVPRDWFFGEVTARFGLASVDTAWGQYRRRMPELVSCPDEVLEALTLLRGDGWTVGREIFEAAAHGCGLDLRAGGWAIGDNPVLDVEGGRAAGLSTAWVSRGKDWPAELAPPDRTVPDVVAAVQVLRDEDAGR
ncbi:HAD family hydrolase [Micromonospora sp. NPDC002575]|uniref:HAD family hydrolase n=1 Tax=Micromonospora sp. NPDC002575 TaxID=3364222 RepID=UPI0036B02599